MTVKTIAKQWIPPILKTQLNTLLKRNINYSGEFKGWLEASNCTLGYDSNLIFQQVKQATLKVKNGEALFERDSVVFDEIQYSFPVLAGLFRAAVENKNQLSVLDFGGSLGSSYFQCQYFLSVLSALEWNIIEQEHFVKCGLEHFRTKELHFYYTINECLFQTKPTVILLSSVLQYLSDPFLILDELMRIGAPYIIIDRTPFSDSATDFVTVQHVPASIYKASYPCWIFSRQSFLTRVTEKYQILTEFESDDNSACVGKLQFKFGGMVLRKL